MKSEKIKSVLTLHNGLELTVCDQTFDWSLKNENIPHVHSPQCVKEITRENDGYFAWNFYGELKEITRENDRYFAWNFNDELIESIHNCPVLVKYFTEDELKQENENK